MAGTPPPKASTGQAAQVITANRLIDGASVFLDRRGAWSLNIADADVATTPAQIEALQRKGADGERAQHIIGAYLVDVDVEDAVPVPRHIRERIRLQGPTVMDVLADWQRTL